MHPVINNTVYTTSLLNSKYDTFWLYSITYHIRKLIYTYQMIGWYKCISLRIWYVVLYNQNFLYMLFQSDGLYTVL